MDLLVDKDRPQFLTKSTSTSNKTTATANAASELLICFTSSSSMKLTKSILSPGHAARDGPVSLSTSLSRRLRANGSAKGGQASPFLTKKRGCGLENPEPTSPKVTCIGQVRVKTKKKVKQRRSLSKRHSGEASFRNVKQSDSKFGDRMKQNDEKICSLQHQRSLNGSARPQEVLPQRKQRWIHLPNTICEGLRAFGAEFNCLLPCKSSCFSAREKQKTDKQIGGSGSDNEQSSCGAVFTRWLVSLNDGEGGNRKEIELVVGGGDEEMKERVSMRSSRRHMFEDIVIKNGEIEVKGETVEGDEEAPRVSICIPPKNALLLMRCRSDPMKMATLADRLSCDAHAAPEEEEEEEETEGGEVTDNKEGLEETDNKEVFEGVDSQEVFEGINNEEVLEETDNKEVFQEVNNQEVLEEIEGVEEQKNIEECDVKDESLMVKEVEVEGATEVNACASGEPDKEQDIPIAEEANLLMELADNDEAVQEQISIEEEVKKDIEQEELSETEVYEDPLMEDQEEVESNMSSFEALLDQDKLENYEDFPVQSETEEELQESPLCISSPSTESDTEENESHEELPLNEETESHKSEEKEEAETSSIDNQITTFHDNEEVNCIAEEQLQFEPKIPENSHQENEQKMAAATIQHETDPPENQELRDNVPNKEKQSPILPECLLLMMCEPKLSMEVSKETWVCSTDFIKRPEKAAKTAAKQELRRSSCSLPPQAAVPTSMATVIEQKLVNAVCYEPIVLSRCKSEPMRTAAAKLMPESFFWKNAVKKLEPAAYRIGAAGFGY